MSIDVWVGQDAEAVAREAAHRLGADLADVLHRQAWATIALAGGQTPRRLYELLAESDLDWTRVHVWPTDERAVPDSHPDSNLRIIREALLAHIAIPIDRVHAFRGNAPDLGAEAIRATAELCEWAGTPPRFNAVVLGIGDDGHTASLFPGDAVLEASESGVAVSEDHERGQARLTLTLPVLRGARHQWILAVGERKIAAVAGLIAGDRRLPIVRATEGRRATLFLDRTAGRELSCGAIHRSEAHHV